MRSIIASLFITLDGVTEEPSDWQETFDEDMSAALNARIARSDTIVMGRGTYDYWAPYWPTATHEPFASYINGTPKYVPSTTLTDVQWGGYDNIAVLDGDLADELAILKQQPGRDISVEASPTLVNWLLQQGLLDELQLFVHNVVASRGTRLFREGGDLTRLTLVDSVISRSGVAILTYRPRAAGS
ncbi:dihydrofolate reductase family protein [Deinococcus yunweiensis]|uniref:dihydrofolate reductase family protein n=1 Tax=Deinococcus yunweiensis TaxID=367282 RepID=UPI00398EBDD3